MKKFLKMGTNSSILLLALIEDILDLSKMEAGTFTLNYSEFEVGPLFDWVYEIFEFQCRSKRIGLSVSVDPRLESITCRSDYGRIRQILLNLLSNSLKFTFEGHIKISAKLIDQNGKGMIQFGVTDTGIGIERKEQKNLFQLFAMIDTSRAINKNGWGIGLTVSKKFVEVLGGEIWIDSEANKGTTISFTIPISGSIEPIEESKSNIYDSALKIHDKSQSLKDYTLVINSSNFMEDSQGSKMKSNQTLSNAPSVSLTPPNIANGIANSHPFRSDKNLAFKSKSLIFPRKHVLSQIDPITL